MRSKVYDLVSLKTNFVYKFNIISDIFFYTTRWLIWSLQVTIPPYIQAPDSTNFSNPMYFTPEDKEESNKKSNKDHTEMSKNHTSTTDSEDNPYVYDNGGSTIVESQDESQT